MTSCTKNKSDQSIGQRKFEKIDSSSLKVDTKTVSRALNIEEVSSTGNIDDFLDHIDSYLLEVGFGRKKTLAISPINERVFRKNCLVESNVKIRYDNSQSRPISVLLYKYDNVENSVLTFNNLVNSEFREGIFKAGGIIVHHTNFIACIIGSCSIEKNDWQSIMNQFQTELPRMNCRCGGLCIEVF